MKQIAFILLICLLSVSCMTVKRIERNCGKFEQICTTGNVDTVIIDNSTVIFLRDTTINFYFPRDTVYLETPLKKIPGKEIDPKLLNTDISYLKAGLAWSTAQVVKGVLKHYLESGDTILQIRLDNALRTEKTLRTELKVSKSYIPIKENTKFAKFTIKWFIGSLVVIILVLVVLFFKYRTKLIGIVKKLV